MWRALKCWKFTFSITINTSVISKYSSKLDNCTLINSPNEGNKRIVLKEYEGISLKCQSPISSWPGVGGGGVFII